MERNDRNLFCQKQAWNELTEANRLMKNNDLAVGKFNTAYRTIFW